MVQATNTVVKVVYKQFSTTNQSFINVHHYLKATGIKNNDFHLILYDADLARIDPRDPNIGPDFMRRILRECLVNFWYFIREIVRIPVEGNIQGERYRLQRGTLAVNFAFSMGWNMFIELPRQQGKTISVCCRILWEFNFSAKNSSIMLINKKHEDAKLNLARIKKIRKLLPSYLRLDSEISDATGKKIKSTNRAETLDHTLNGNSIVTLPSARNKVLADQLGRGCTQPRQWYDEFAFIPHVGIVYASATPAYKTASDNAKKFNNPYGIVISTTPGDLTTEEGQYAFKFKNSAIPFSEAFYDRTQQELTEMIQNNDNSSFIYIRYTYQQLGLSEEWFRAMVIELQKDWPKIRREVLLEWSTISDNSPFSKEDLNIVRGLIKEPIDTIFLGPKLYQLYIYERFDPRYPPIIGVDVSGGYNKDSSAITIIDSRTTDVVGCLNCNYISTGDLARVIHELVARYMPNAVVNVERNGGFGASVISYLLQTQIKRNLYYEIKDRVNEERTDGIHTFRHKVRTKVYGLDSTKAIRDKLIEILRERMTYHKDKFISPIIYHELETLEVKRNGKVEHSDTGHDDQIFSYLLALYVWYEGTHLMENWGIQKTTIKCEEHYDEEIFSDTRTEERIGEYIVDSDDNIVEDQMQYIASDHTVSFEDWEKQQSTQDQEMLNQLLRTSKVARMAYEKKYNTSVEKDFSSGMFTIPTSVFTSLNQNPSEDINYNVTIMDPNLMFNRINRM